MSELYGLPNGWEWKQLFEVCSEITDGSHNSPKSIDKGKLYITVKDINENGCIDFHNCKHISDVDFELLKRNKCMPHKGDVLLSKDGTVGKVALNNYDIEFVVLSSIAILRPQKILLSNFLTKYLQSPSFYNNAIDSKTGAAIKRIVLKTIKTFNIPLPPLSEQQRIVRKLDLLFEKIDKAIFLHQKNIDEAEAFMGSVLNEVFKELEEKYKSIFLSNFCQITSSKRVHKSDYVDIGIPFYRIKDIILKTRNKHLKDTECISEDVFDVFDKKFGSPKSGDILITAVGATLGFVYLVRDSDGKFYFKDGNILWLRKISTNMNPQYLIYSFVSPIFQQFITEISKGAAQPAITIEKLNELSIPLPPLAIQQKTVQYLDDISEKIERVKTIQKEKMANLKALKASILDKAFRGEI